MEASISDKKLKLCHLLGICRQFFLRLCKLNLSNLYLSKLFRFNKGGGGCQHWPTGRGIYISNDEKFLVWINEEDHLRIISMDKGGDLFAIYKRYRKHDLFNFKKFFEVLLIMLYLMVLVLQILYFSTI